MGKCNYQSDSAVASLLYREPIGLFVHEFHFFVELNGSDQCSSGLVRTT